MIVFYLNGDIDFSNSLLFDLEDHQYFPIIHNLSNFNFYPIYDNQVEPLNPIVMPFYSIIYSHTPNRHKVPELYSKAKNS